jgi:hypothetical protein
MEAQAVVTGGQYTPKPRATGDEPKGIVRFSNKVQGLAYGGAAALVVIVGLRSIYGRNIPAWVVISALALEALLLLMIATVYYLTPEDKGGAAPSTDSQILSGEKEILQLLKRDIIPGEGEMIKAQREMATGQRELVHVMRNEMLTGQRDMYNVLRNELIQAESEALQTLQRTETQIAKMNDLLSSQHQMYNTLRSELINGEAEALRVLQQIESHIGKVVENEIERVVQAKVQEVFTSMVRQEVHKSLEANRNSND